MAYQNYLRNLDFGGVSDSIQTLKSQEYGRASNSLDLQSLNLQGKINDLTEDESVKDKLENTVTTIGDATGISLENGSVGKLVKGVKAKFGSLKDAASKLKSKFQDGVDSAKDKLGDLKSSAEDKLSDLKSSAQDQLSDAKAQFTGDAPAQSQPQEIEMRTFSSDETKSSVADGDNPDEIAYSSDNPGVPQTSARGGEIEMQDLSSDPPPGSEIEMQDLGTDNYLGSSGGGGGNFGKASYADSINEETGYGSGNLLQSPHQTADIAQPTTEEGSTVADTSAEGGTVASDGADVAADATGAAEEGTTAAGEAAGEAGAAAGEAAGEVAGAVATDAGVGIAEGVSVGLDSTGILAPLGVLLGIGAAIFGGVETAKSAADASAATTDEDAQNALAQQKNAIQKNIANQRFVGANVTPGLSSTTANAVTSGAF